MRSIECNVQELRRRTTAILLSKLYFEGPLGRSDLARITGLSAPTVSSVIGKLTEDGLTVPAGTGASEGGRPRILMQVNPSYGYSVGVDIGEASVTAGLFDLNMNLLATSERPLPKGRVGVPDIASAVDAGVRDSVIRAKVSEDALIGIGLSLPDRVGSVTCGRGFAETLVGRIDAHRLGPSISTTAVPVSRGLAEAWCGAGRGARRVVVVLIDEGVDAVVISSENLPSQVTGGGWGHSAICHRGRLCPCGRRGCIEAYSGAGEIVKRYARSGLAGDADSGLKETYAEFLEAAEGRNAASRILREAIDFLGAGLGNLITLFEPDRVVLAGWAGVKLGESAMHAIRKAALRGVRQDVAAGLIFELGKVESRAALIGAATLPVAALIEQDAVVSAS
ncbi:ROK family protein [Amycolatopsis japonica]